MPHWLRYTLLAIVFLLLASWPLARQLEDTAIEGRITDQTGPVSGASVEARNIMTGAVANATSGTDGSYRLGGLKAGRYSLWITAPDHCSVWIERIAVEQGDVVRRDIRLNRTGSTTAPCAPSTSMTE